MAKKEYMLRGKKLEELKQMSHKEFAEHLDARRRRTILKGFSEPQKRFLSKLEKKGDNVKTHCRSMIILPNMVGKTIHVYNGKTFSPVMIQAEMLGHLLGEFVLTRNRVTHNAPGVGATRSSASVSVK